MRTFPSQQFKTNAPLSCKLSFGVMIQALFLLLQYCAVWY